MMDFDYDAFYQYCIDKSKDNIVYISSYMMPKQFECVDVLKTSEKKHMCSFKLEGRDTVIKDECLWMVRGGFGVNDLYHDDSAIDF